jgi:ABC-type multidrug transport system fused ATPase/permease subunit
VLLLQSSSTSLGSLALYRSSIQSVVFTVQNLITTTRMAYQSIFLMGAFCAATKIQPRLQPKDEEVLSYRPMPGGAKIQARQVNTSWCHQIIQIHYRNLSYTYPGSKDPCLRGVSFDVEAGETLAIVGYNGSGAWTIKHSLLTRSFNPRYNQANRLWPNFCFGSSNLMRENSS